MESEKAICWRCFDDVYLSDVVKEYGKQLECSACGGLSNHAFSISELGIFLEPIIRANFEHGVSAWESPFDEMDEDFSSRQDGDDLCWVVQTVMDQSFAFDDEIAAAVADAENWHPRDGDEPFYGDDFCFVKATAHPYRYFHDWERVSLDLKHKHRFFSPSAKSLFDRLFLEVEMAVKWDPDRGEGESVVVDLPKGTRLYRARKLSSGAEVRSALIDPWKQVGPPPANLARAGRMNAEGVVVFYGAKDSQTALAELRPALGDRSVIIQAETTRPLRVLDFTKLPECVNSKPLSYLQADYRDQLERQEFMKHLHDLISRPIIPGTEAEYLITQTMSEYLAHIHHSSFDGILFGSVQRGGGINIVIFPDRESASSAPDNMFAPMLSEIESSFALTYVINSALLFDTAKIEYEHSPVRYTKRGDLLWVFGDNDLYGDFNDDPF